MGEAAEAYREVAAILEEGTDLLPFPGKRRLEEPDRRKELAGCLQRAMAAEEQGVGLIERALPLVR